MPNFKKTFKGYGVIFWLIIPTLLSGCAGLKGAKKSFEKDRETALQLLREGAELLYAHDQEALEKFDAAALKDPSLYAASYNAGVALENLGNLSGSEKRYESCLAVYKKQGSCLTNLVLVKAKLNQLTEARKLVDQYLLDFPDETFPKVAAAELALYEKDYATAEKWARAVIEQEAENVSALYVMARVFFATKRYYAAKWVVKNAHELAFSHGGLYLLAGDINTALSLMRDALDAYELAVKYQPNEESLERYGLLLLRLGRAKEALPILKRLTKLRPLETKNFFI